MSKQRILIQIDSDAQASTFDSVVAVDAGVDHVFRHAGVTEQEIESIVHGAMFTRGPNELKNTALFFGGSDIQKTEALVAAAKKCFFGAMRVSMMVDPNGCNTTAAAAVLASSPYCNRSNTSDGKTVTILAGTGPVGQRIAHLIAGSATVGAEPSVIRVCSRSSKKAQVVCEQLGKTVSSTARFVPMVCGTLAESFAAIDGADLVFSAGAGGVETLPTGWLEMEKLPACVVDLNAVPPSGIHGVEVTNNAQRRHDVVCFGAIAIGGLKMKIHRRCLQAIFESNDQVLDADQMLEQGAVL